MSHDESHPAPWKIRELKGKYYGTEIEDAEGRLVLKVWLPEGLPSARERGDTPLSEWECGHGHWESEMAFAVSTAIVAARNEVERANQNCYDEPSPETESLLRMLTEFAKSSPWGSRQ